VAGGCGVRGRGVREGNLGDEAGKLKGGGGKGWGLFCEGSGCSGAGGGRIGSAGVDGGSWGAWG